MRSPAEIQDSETPSVNITNVPVAAGPSRLRTFLKIGACIVIVLLFLSFLPGFISDVDDVPIPVSTGDVFARPDLILDMPWEVSYMTSNSYGVFVNDQVIHVGIGDGYLGWRLQGFGNGWIDFAKEGTTKRVRIRRQHPSSVWKDTVPDTSQGTKQDKPRKGLFSRD